MGKNGVKILLILGVLFFLGSCKSDKSQENHFSQEELLVLNEELALDTLKEDLSFYRFPSPEEMLRYINTGNLTYSPFVLHPVSDAKNYLNSYTQSLNMGTYIADLAYIVLFEKLKDAQNYFQVVEYLSNKVSLEILFDQETKKRISYNLENIDSISVIAKDTYNKLVKHLDKTNNDRTLAIISAGAYIEALYLALEQIEEYQAGNPMMMKVFEQQFAFENLISFVDNLGNDENINKLSGQLRQINNVFKEVQYTYAKQKTEVRNDGSLNLGGSVKSLNVTRDNFYKLKKVVNNVRDEVVNTI